MMTGYLALEARRALRNPRFLFFTLVFPLGLFLVFKGMYGNSDVQGTHVPYAGYLMCSMAAFGAFSAAMNAGARVSEERTLGWQRQLRLTPLSPPGYLLSKVAVSMIVAFPPVALVCIVGAFTGVHLSPGAWLQVVLGVWVATLPFAVLGLLLGQIAKGDSIQLYTSVVMMVCSLLGGIWIPVQIFPTWLANIAQAMPSYWVADIGQGAVMGTHDLGKAVLILAVWALVLGFLVTRRYQRDSARA